MMTKEKAIFLLSQMFLIQFSKEEHEALAMAIDVLNADHKTESSADRLQKDSLSRRYLLAEIDDLADEFSEIDENGLHSERWCGIMDAKQIIINAPFMSDRPQGEWIIEIDANGNTYGRCSICGMRQYAGQLNFCPDCGARMKREDND